MKGPLDDLALLSLCDGYGGTELALRSLGRVRTVCRVERDAYAASVLVARMEEQKLDPCPLWDCLETFDGAAWRGRVHIVAAGFPCPDFSVAGLRAGVDGEHWLWPECYKIIRDVGPRWVLLENVPGLVRLGGLTRVLSDLALDGFDAQWGLYSAADIGAPHERERWWLVAHNDQHGQPLEWLRPELADQPDDADGRGGAQLGDAGGARRQQVPRGAHGNEGADGREPDPADVAAGAGEAFPDAYGARLEISARRGGFGETALGDTAGRGAALGNATSIGRRSEVGPGTNERQGGLADADVASEELADPAREQEGERHPRDLAIARHDSRRTVERHRFPPCRDDVDGWLRWEGAQPAVRRKPDGTPRWLADSLHLGGNGLVPQCAAEAWRQLIERFES